VSDLDPKIRPAVDRVLKALDGCDLPDGLRVWVEVGDETESAPQARGQMARLLKADPAAEERYVLGIVLEPLKELGKVDSQDDLYSAEEVRQACYKWMEDYQDIGRQHTDIVTGKVKVLENWITREDSTIGGQPVAKGTWLVGVRVLDDEMWGAVKKGDITGFSIGGWANRAPVKA